MDWGMTEWAGMWHPWGEDIYLQGFSAEFRQQEDDFISYSKESQALSARRNNPAC